MRNTGLLCTACYVGTMLKNGNVLVCTHCKIEKKDSRRLRTFLKAATENFQNLQWVKELRLKAEKEKARKSPQLRLVV